MNTTTEMKTYTCLLCVLGNF